MSAVGGPSVVRAATREVHIGARKPSSPVGSVCCTLSPWLTGCCQAMLPPANRDAAAKSRAAAAAAVAAASVTPGQRERAIQEAALAALKAREAAAAAASAEAGEAPAPYAASDDNQQQQSQDGVSAVAGSNGQAAAAGPAGYEPPEWSGIPEGAPYGMEILKNGVLVETKDLTGQPYFTFGRSPTADVLLEHPSASRLHAVLQFDGSSKGAFLYDCGSTHGTFLNKNKLKARVHAPLRVGDTFRFGQSSRMYVLTGPQELMPQEGLSKQQKKQLAMLEAAQARMAADEAKARAQMEAALSGSAADGVNWGMAGDDGDFEAQAAADNINWRSYVDKNKLSDRQTKILDKIRKREYKIKNLEAECAKISAKERSEGGLTQGQAATLVRNERALEAIREELEELEEQLTDSIADSIKGKQAAKESKEGQQPKKRKRTADSDDEYAAEDDTDDEFYDRTVTAVGPKKKTAGKDKAAAKGVTGEPAKVESAETLYAKRAALLEEKQRIETEIAAEQRVLEHQQQQQRTAESGQQQQQQQEPQQQQPGEATAPAAGAADGDAETAAEETPDGEGVDSLDAFMSDVAQNLEVDKLTSLRKELESIEQQIHRTERLIHIADPDGWYNPHEAGNVGRTAAAKAAAEAKAAAKAALEADRQRRAEAVARQRAGWAAAQAAGEAPPEQEHEEDHGDDQHMQDTADANPAAASTAAAAEGSGPAAAAQGSGPTAAPKRAPVIIKPKGLLASKPLQQKPELAAAAAAAKPAAAAAATGGAGKPADAAAAAQQLMKEFAQPAPVVKKVVKGPTMPPPGYKAAAKPAAAGSNVNAAAAARVAASIAILTSHTAPLGTAEDQEDRQQQDDDGAGGWVPPANQTGDGKTDLNAKLGY